MMWQPIETAPKDGTEVLLAHAEPDLYFVSIARWNGRAGWDDGDFRDCMTGFTHWMPLPAPPEPTLTRAEAVQAIRDGKIERYCVPGQWRTVMVHGVPIVEELG